MEEVHPILAMKIQHIVASDDFIKACELNGFNKLADIIKLPAHQILNLPGFNVHMLMELYTILKGYKIENLLKD